MKHLRLILIFTSILVLFNIFSSSTAYLYSYPNFKPNYLPRAAVNLKITGPNGDAVPVVNEGKNLMLKVVDSAGNSINGAKFETDSPDVVNIDPSTGQAQGLTRGFATITARLGNDSISTFLVVTRLNKSKGATVPGKTEVNITGDIFISDPINNIIRRRSANTTTKTDIYAGQLGKRGLKDGNSITDALFAGPLGIGVDNTSQGGLFVADSLNNCIRKIDNRGNVATILGNGISGTIKDVASFDQAAFKNPQGLAVDRGGNLFIADTGNHAIYYADFTKKEVRLVAGNPGVSGKADGQGNNALFNRPFAISLQSSKTSFFSTANNDVLLVADNGNNVIRAVTRDGKVTTLGPIANTIANTIAPQADGTNEFTFNSPTGISTDDLGNVYVVDNNGVKVIIPTRTQTQTNLQVIGLTQDGSFNQASNVTAFGKRTFVLDAMASSDDAAVTEVTVGAPQILNLSRSSATLSGNEEVIITGKNFAPESLVILGDGVAQDFSVISATQIRFKVPTQTAPGVRTLSVQTRGGVAQQAFSIMPKNIKDLANGEITTYVGGVEFTGDGGNAFNATLDFADQVSGIAMDKDGNLFIADSNHNTIRRVDVSGVITTVAGNGRNGFNGDGALAINASLNHPRGLAFDRNGNLFIADLENNRVRRIDVTTGIIKTVAGGGNQPIADNIPATQADIRPTDIAIDRNGNLLITDETHSRVRRVDMATGIIKTVAGSGEAFRGGFAGDGDLATKALLNSPIGIALDDKDNVYIADSANFRIRRVDALTNIITTIAGNGKASKDSFNVGDGGSALSATFNIPASVALDSNGNIYVCDIFNQRVRRIDATTNIITTVAGNGQFDFSNDDQPATQAALVNPVGIAIDGNNNLFIPEIVYSRVRRVDGVTNKISTIVGISSAMFAGDNLPALMSSVKVPRGLATDKLANLYIADQGHNRVRSVDANTTIIKTLAGNGNFDFTGDGGTATLASLYNPLDVAVDTNGNILIADRENARVRKVDSNGTITTIAGGGKNGLGDGGLATNAVFKSVVAIAVDSKNNLYISDSADARVRKVDGRTGIITTLAGNGTSSFSGDGGMATSASLNTPGSLAVDAAGNVFIFDFLNFRVRRVDTKGIITTVAGNGNGLNLFSGGGIALDSAGNLFISENGAHRILRLDAKTGTTSVVAGNGTPDYTGDNAMAISASLNFPDGLTVDNAGNLYISDFGNNVIRVVKGVGAKAAQVTISNAVFNKPTLTINGTGLGSAGSIVTVNGKNVSQFINSQNDNTLVLKGNKNKLNIKKGANTVSIQVGASVSNTFTFNF